MGSGMKYRVAEIFGPTVQGEGSDVGKACYFVRLGGCDYRCIWCDSMHAVEPGSVARLPLMTSEEIVKEVMKLPGDYQTVVFSGGNPMLYDLEPLIREFTRNGRFRFTMETQASVGKTLPDWARLLDLIVFSPKPPSALAPEYNAFSLSNYLSAASVLNVPHIVKIVVFDLTDLNFAVKVAQDMNLNEIYISCGTMASDLRITVVERYAWLIENALRAFAHTGITPIILPQLHVVVWGHKLGV